MTDDQLFEDPGKPKRKRKLDNTSPEARIYLAYPLRRDRGHALPAITKALEFVDFDTLMAAVKRWAVCDEVAWYIASGRPEYIARCSTWMKGQRWLDEIPETQKERNDRRDKVLRERHEKEEAERRKGEAKGARERAERQAIIDQMHDTEFHRLRTEAIEAAGKNNFLRESLSRQPARKNHLLAFEICNLLDAEGER